MSLISLSNVSVSFGANDILDNVTCEANLRERIGLVGRNGAGKTTLLHVLAGLEPARTGQRHAASWLRSVMVEQIPSSVSGAVTVRDEVLSSVQDVVALEAALGEAATAMAEGDAEAEEHYANLLQRMEHEGAFIYEARFAQIMSGLGFDEADWDKPLAVLSGGQRSRVGLARALMSEPDLLLMDEPTNHLDLQGLRWLESFLSAWRGTVIVTSHDRYFLDKIATRIWQVENRRLRSYPGNYSKYEGLREADTERQQRELERQQEFIAKEEAFIRRYGAGQRAAEAQGRAKRLARLERIEAPARQRSVRFNLRSGRSGEVVLRAEELTVGYGATPVLRLGDLELERGARVALVGRNGAGKSTLLRTISGDLAPVAGEAHLGANVSVAHYWQEAEGLDGSLTVLQELLRDDPDMQAARDLAGRFLFSGEEVTKSVASLSGGERSRLALAKLVRSGANFLLLDEPTNHLDIPSREALEDALAAFGGTLLFASHDRRLIERLASRLWVIENDGLVQFDGSLAEYDKEAEPATAPVQPKPENRPKQLSGNEQRRRNEALGLLEAAIIEKEEEIEGLEESINLASRDGNAALVGELGRRFEALQAEVERLLLEWTGQNQDATES